MVLAQAIYLGPTEIKSLILLMCSNNLFPIGQVSKAMKEMQSMVQIGPSSNGSTNIPESLCFPTLSVAQLERLEFVINKVEV